MFAAIHQAIEIIFCEANLSFGQLYVDSVLNFSFRQVRQRVGWIFGVFGSHYDITPEAITFSV
jgi:hypothetical protein